MVGGLVGLGLLLSGVARADAGRVMVLGAIVDGKNDGLAVDRLSEGLTRGGVNVVPQGTLSAADRACQDQECLDALAGRQVADTIMSFRAQRAEGHDYFVTGWLYTVSRHGVTADNRDICKSCDHGALVDKMKDLAADLLKPARPAARVPAQPGPAAPVTPPDTQPAPRTTWVRGARPAWRWALGGSLLGLGAIGIGLGAYGASEDGRIATSADMASCGASASGCALDTTRAYGTGLGLGIALGLAGGVILVLPGPMVEVPAASTAGGQP